MKKAMQGIGLGTVILAALLVIPIVGLAAGDEVRLGVISPASGNYADLGAA